MFHYTQETNFDFSNTRNFSYLNVSIIFQCIWTFQWNFLRDTIPYVLFVINNCLIQLYLSPIGYFKCNRTLFSQDKSAFINWFTYVHGLVSKKLKTHSSINRIHVWLLEKTYLKCSPLPIQSSNQRTVSTRAQRMWNSIISWWGSVRNDPRTVSYLKKHNRRKFGHWERERQQSQQHWRSDTFRFFIMRFKACIQVMNRSAGYERPSTIKTAHGWLKKYDG